MEFEWHVGDVVRKLRLRKHLTQKDLADAASVHHNTIVRLEDGDEGIQGRTLQRVAIALGVTTKQLWRLVPDQPEEAQRATVKRNGDPAPGEPFRGVPTGVATSKHVHRKTSR